GTATYTMNFGTLATPTISPAAGTYTDPLTITLSGPAGATIRYTTDGSTPTASSTAYSTPFTLPLSCTLKAVAFKVDYTTSATASAAYTLIVATPTFTPGGGSYAPSQNITISTATAGATIYYTLNGIDPTTTDPVIPSGGTINVGTFTLKAKAMKTGLTASA